MSAGTFIKEWCARYAPIEGSADAPEPLLCRQKFESNRDVFLETIAIAGASGFIGRHLVQALLRQGGYRIKVLSRTAHCAHTKSAFPPGVEVVRGDLRVPASLDGFLEAGCTVINLVYLWDKGYEVNLLAIRHLLAACNSAKVSRLVHCSTADVAGRTPDLRVTESSSCRPVTSYALTKLKVENAVLSAGRDGLGVAVLRPTAVFGAGGQNLKKLANDLIEGITLKNDLKVALLGRRRMNLVYIDNVVAAIMFLMKPDIALESEIFIVSDDDSPANEFSGVDRAMRRGFGIAESVWPCTLFPSWMLSMILRALGRNNVDPARTYDPSKLLELGFVRPVDFEEGLSRYIAWYGMEYLDRLRKVDS